MDTKKLVVFGLGQRGNIYATFAKKYPEKFQLVAIIETDEKRIEYAKNTFTGVPVFNDYVEFLKEKIPADLVAVCTQDEQHKEHAVQMMQNGYDLLLEKPIANRYKDCVEIYKASVRYQRKVIVCHVLRYTPFYSTVKAIIDSGELGDLITIHASENVGYYHQAHSFVRGPWRNKELSSPMILAKCCHDMDILRYLMGEKCLSVNSYGSLSYFCAENAPEGAAKFCTDCKHKDCIYNAEKLYTSDFSKWAAAYFTTKELTDENILADLPHTDYDRCVYQCDNDVVDHQVSILRFEKGKTATHTMTAFSKEIYRDIKIHGTKAELVGNVEDNFIEIRPFGGENRTVPVSTARADVGGHMGGDFFLMEGVYKTLNGVPAEGITYLDVSIESHLICFAAEESRLHGGRTEKIKI